MTGPTPLYHVLADAMQDFSFVLDGDRHDRLRTAIALLADPEVRSALTEAIAEAHATIDHGLLRRDEGVGKRVYQCPGCFSLTFWKALKDPGATFECECGERLTRIDLRDPESQAIPRHVLDRLAALETVAEAARGMTCEADRYWQYLRPLVETIDALDAALARLDKVTP